MSSGDGESGDVRKQSVEGIRLQEPNDHKTFVRDIRAIKISGSTTRKNCIVRKSERFSKKKKNTFARLRNTCGGGEVRDWFHNSTTHSVSFTQPNFLLFFISRRIKIWLSILRSRFAVLRLFSPLDFKSIGQPKRIFRTCDKNNPCTNRKPRSAVTSWSIRPKSNPCGNYTVAYKLNILRLPVGRSVFICPGRECGRRSTGYRTIWDCSAKVCSTFLSSDSSDLFRNRQSRAYRFRA